MITRDSLRIIPEYWADLLIHGLASYTRWARWSMLLIVASFLTYVLSNPQVADSWSREESRMGAAMSNGFTVLLWTGAGAWATGKTVRFLAKDDD